MGIEKQAENRVLEVQGGKTKIFLCFIYKFYAFVFHLSLEKNHEAMKV